MATVLNTVANRVKCKKKYINKHRPNFFADNLDKKGKLEWYCISQQEKKITFLFSQA